MWAPASHRVSSGETMGASIVEKAVIDAESAEHDEREDRYRDPGAAVLPLLEAASVTGGGVMGCLGSSDHRWSVGEDTRGADSPRSETSASQFAVRTHLRFEH